MFLNFPLNQSECKLGGMKFKKIKTVGSQKTNMKTNRRKFKLKTEKNI